MASQNHLSHIPTQAIHPTRFRVWKSQKVNHLQCLRIVPNHLRYVLFISFLLGLELHNGWLLIAPYFSFYAINFVNIVFWTLITWNEKDSDSNTVLVLFCRHCYIGSLVIIILCIQILWLQKLQGLYSPIPLGCITAILPYWTFSFKLELIYVFTVMLFAFDFLFCVWTLKETN